MVTLNKLHYICVSLTICIWGTLNAQLFKQFGGQRVGTTSFVFLKIGVDVRSEGMGQTLVSTADDASGTYFNPATALSISRCVTFSHTNWLVDIKYEYLGVAVRLNSKALALQVASLSSGYMKETDELHPFGTGRYFRFGDLLVSLTYAFRITDRFAIGAAIKGIMETLADLHSYGVALDIGSIYDVGYRNIKIGMALLNMGPDVHPYGTYAIAGIQYRYESFPLPVIYKIGVSGNIFKNLLIALEMDKPSDNVEIFKLGLEYNPLPVIALRAGYRVNAKPPGSIGISFGGGFNIDWRGSRLILNYAFTELGYIGYVHRMSISFGL